MTVLLKDDSGLNYRGSASNRREIYKMKAEYFLDSEESVISTLSESEFTLDYKFSIMNSFSGFVTKEGLDKLEKNPRVLFIEAQRGLSVGLDDTTSIINATDAWESGYSGEGVAVCVLDTGVNYTHPALGGCFGSGCKVVGGYDYCQGNSCFQQDSDPMDEDDVKLGHGTHVAGIVASNDTTYKGVAPNASIIAMKVCNDGSYCGTNAIKKAVDWCVNNASIYNIKVITLSIYDGEEYGSDCNPVGKVAATTALNNANDSGIFVDAISGNDRHRQGISWPGCVRGVTSVGATTNIDTIWVDSNTGPNLDLLAPGDSIHSTSYQGGLVSFSGTSMAAPHVAGAAALLFERDPTLFPDQVKDIFQETGKEVGSWKRIDVAEAIDSLCVFGNWTDGSCGVGSCGSFQRQQTRTADPPQCGETTQCQYDESCVSGTTQTICSSGCNYTTIQDALDNSGNDDLLKITDSGTYNEDLNWDNSGDRVILNCQGATITSSGFAMKMNNSIGNVVMNCIINSSNGVKLSGNGNNNEFIANVFDIEEKAINIRGDATGDTGGTSIVDNLIYNAGEEAAVLVSGTSGNYPGDVYIKGNSLFNNLYGISFRRSNFNQILENIIQGGTYGIYFDGSSFDLDNVVDGNNITGSDYGVYILDQEGIDITEGYICSNSIYDIQIDDLTGNTGSDNTCENTLRWNDTGYDGCTNYCDSPPSLLLLNPFDNSTYITSNDVDLDCYSSDNYQLVNVTLYHNISGTWQANQTVSVSGASNTTTFTITVANNTNFEWNCLAYDNRSRASFSATNWSTNVIVDTSNPGVDILSPLNQTYNASSINFNVLLSEVGSCEYSIDNGATNTTMSSLDWLNFSYVDSSISNGGYRANFYCEDDAGNKNHSESISFNINAPDPSLVVSLISPNTNTTVDKDEFFDFTSQVCCYDANCGEVSVSLDPETHEYTSSTETHCKEGVCNKIIHSGRRFVYEDNKWKKIENARSLKGIWDVRVDEDHNFPIEIVDYNYTSLILDLMVSESKSDKQIDLRVYNKNNKTKKPKDSRGNTRNKDLKIRLPNKNEVRRHLIDLSDTDESILGQEIKWGDNSTYITLQDADVENLDDALTREANPSSNYGSQTYLRSQASFSGYLQYIFVKFNLSDIPENSDIVESKFGLYLYSNGYDNGNEGQSLGNYYVYSNFSWDEGSITWNTMPNENQSSPLYDSYVDFNGDTPLGWYYWDVTSISRGANNFSVYMVPFVMIGSPSSTDYLQFYSKEYSTDVTKRPYLNVTYNEPRVKGLISTTVGDVPFYTVTNNPYNLSLSKDECINITWSVNSTGNDTDMYVFFTFVNKTSNMSISNKSSEIFLTIKKSYDYLLDIIYPLEGNVANVTSGGNVTVQFNLSDIEGNDVNESLVINNLTIGGVQASFIPRVINPINSLDYSGFESGTQGWNFGGSDGSRSSDRSNVTDLGVDGGSFSAHIQDDTTESHFQKSLDFQYMDSVNLSFWSWESSFESGEYVQVLCDGSEVWRLTDGEYSENEWILFSVNITPSDCSFDNSVVIRFEGNPGLGTSTDDWYVDGINFTGHSSQMGPWYTSGVGWKVNITVPNNLTGYGDLVMNVTNGSVESIGIENNSVHYD